MKTEQEIREARELFVAAARRHSPGQSRSTASAAAAAFDWILGENGAASAAMELQIAHLREFFAASTPEERRASTEACMEKARILEDDYRHRN